MAEPTKAAAAPAEPLDAKFVTWTGEDDLHYINQVGEDGITIEKVQTSGPSFLLWNKIRFDKDKPVLIDPSQAKTADEKTMYNHILKKTPNMARFTVEDAQTKGRTPGDDLVDDDEVDDDEVVEPVHEGEHTRPKPKGKKRR
jgi:hypothetical protein